MPIPTLAAFCLALACCGSALAQPIYKWVDGQGATHYSSTPPPAGVPSTQIQAPQAPSAQAASQAQSDAQRGIELAERLAADRRRDEAMRRAQADASQRNADWRRQRCATTRAQLELLQRGGAVLRFDERGQRVYLPDERRDAERARLQAEAAAWCSAEDQAAPQAPGPRPPASPLACVLARERLRELQAEAMRTVPSDLAAARQRVQQACDGP